MHPLRMHLSQHVWCSLSIALATILFKLMMSNISATLPVTTTPSEICPHCQECGSGNVVDDFDLCLEVATPRQRPIDPSHASERRSLSHATLRSHYEVPVDVDGAVRLLHELSWLHAEHRALRVLTSVVGVELTLESVGALKLPLRKMLPYHGSSA